VGGESEEHGQHAKVLQSLELSYKERAYPAVVLSVCTLAKIIFLTLQVLILFTFFPNPTHETKIGITF
jgi:hypothetical protein